MGDLIFTEKLLDTLPFDNSPQNKKLFLESFKEVAQKHYDGNPIFRGFWDKAHITPESLQDETDLEKVPPLMVHLFKEWHLSSVPEEEIVLRLTSSGTSGQKSQMLLNEGSLRRVKKLAYNIHRALGMTSESETNYICFTYDPKIANDLGTAFTDELLTHFTKISNVYYAFQWDPEKKEFFLDEPGLLHTFLQYSQEKKPVRILGFPALIYKFFRDHKISFQFGPLSWVQTGGGWKGYANEEIPKDDFRVFVSSRLGIPKENVRDLFGMVEHGIPYVDCSLGQLHIPHYARIFIRDPKTLKCLPRGEKGLIQFLCTYNDSYPSMNLLTTDWGRLSTCQCGIAGDTLEILGRAGVALHKGCAITALEVIQ